MSEAELKLRASIAAHESWARTPDRTARTDAARRTYRESFEDVVDPDGTLDPAERSRRAEHAYKAHMQRLALKSAKARRLARSTPGEAA
ncbi:MAG TPA: hypothetical protein VHK88_00110 [Aquihabitans sp.]|jgi:hypothetical protein|nr:hypothetical protein [Aquihabitans sp.]